MRSYPCVYFYALLAKKILHRIDPRRADARPASLPNGRISLAGNHLAQVWQVGEGVSPALDAFSIWGRAYRSQGRAQLSLAVSMTSRSALSFFGAQCRVNAVVAITTSLICLRSPPDAD
jgi:hypothetical protein